MYPRHRSGSSQHVTTPGIEGRLAVLVPVDVRGLVDSGLVGDRVERQQRRTDAPLTPGCEVVEGRGRRGPYDLPLTHDEVGRVTQRVLRPLAPRCRRGSNV